MPTRTHFHFTCTNVSIAASSIQQRTCYNRQKSGKQEAKPVVSYYSDNNMSLVRSHNTTWYGNTTPATAAVTMKSLAWWLTNWAE
jgi:hypothetical protein